MNNEEKYIEIENECGLFKIDTNGWLISFVPNTSHYFHYRGFINGLEIQKFKYFLKHLHIPEGVRFIGKDHTKNIPSNCEEFRDTFVLGRVTLPNSLLAIMPCAFSGCIINSILLPKTLRQIGVGSFMCSLIYQLNIEKSSFQFQYEMLEEKALICVPENMLFVGGRSFKESVINELQIFCKEGKVDSINLETKAVGSRSVSGLMPETDVAKLIFIPDNE